MEKKDLIRKCIEILKDGGVILCPTDSIWGLSCDATNNTAVEKILQIKERDPSKSFIVLVTTDAMINNSIKEIPEVAWDILDLATEPTSLIMQATNYLAPRVVHENGTVAIRKVNEGFIYELLQAYRKPMVSTSANISGKKTPFNRENVAEELIAQLDFEVPKKWGEKMSGKPSKIIKIELNGSVEIIRA